MKPTLLALFILTAAHLARAADAPEPTLDEKLRASQRQPLLLDIPIAWEPVKGGSNGESAWLIHGTIWRIRLYPDSWNIDKLDKATAYIIHGVALEEDYGVIQIWVYNIKKK